MALRNPVRQPFRITLDDRSGVPVYRQIMDRITFAIAAGTLQPGDQLPTMRQLAVDLAINPNTVIRAYRELEIRGVIDTQQGTGTFIGERTVDTGGSERQIQLRRFASDCVAQAGAAGFSLSALIAQLRELQAERKKYTGNEDAEK